MPVTGTKPSPSRTNFVGSNHGSDSTISAGKPTPEKTTPSRATKNWRGSAPGSWAITLTTGVRSVSCTRNVDGKTFVSTAD